MESNAHKRDGYGQIEMKILKNVSYPHIKVWPKLSQNTYPCWNTIYIVPCVDEKWKKKKKLSCYLMFNKIGLTVWSPSKC